MNFVKQSTCLKKSNLLVAIRSVLSISLNRKFNSVTFKNVDIHPSITLIDKEKLLITYEKYKRRVCHPWFKAWSTAIRNTHWNKVELIII